MKHHSSALAAITRNYSRIHEPCILCAGNFYYATDGKVGVRIPSDQIEIESDTIVMIPGKDPVIDRVINGCINLPWDFAECSTHPCPPLPDYQAVFRLRDEQCEQCEGHGCSTLLIGEGHLGEECQHCGGKGKLENKQIEDEQKHLIRVKTRAAVFNPKFLHLLREAIQPDLCRLMPPDIIEGWSGDRPMLMARNSITGAVGIVMPMKTHPNELEPATTTPTT